MKQKRPSVDVAALIKELRPRLFDDKITKIYQHSPDEIRIGLHIFKEGRTNLIIEAGRRFHLTSHPDIAPKLPQSFPMLLRKHLSGGRITEISQYDFDRIIELHVQRGEDRTILIIELFSRGNIILLDAEEVGQRAGIEKSMPARQLSDVTPVLNALTEIFKPLSEGLKPHIVSMDGKPADVLPFELSRYEKNEKKYFGTFNEALDEYFSSVAPKTSEEEAIETKPKKLGAYEYRLEKQTLAL